MLYFRTTLFSAQLAIPRGYPLNGFVFKPQVDWGDKGSTEAGARLAKAKVNKMVVEVFCMSVRLAFFGKIPFF